MIKYIISYIYWRLCLSPILPIKIILDTYKYCKQLLDHGSVF